MRAWIAAAAGALAIGCAAAQPVQSPPASPLELADGVSLLPGRFDPGRQPDGNSLLLRGTDGLVIVDTGRHAAHAAALADWARGQTLPLKAVINTHWHLDHLGGNAALRRGLPGWKAHGSPALRDAVLKRMPESERQLRLVRDNPSTDAATRSMVEIDLGLYAVRADLLPDVLVNAPSVDVTLGGRALRMGLASGPTRGDLWVLDLASRTLAIGDFITLPVPFLDTACPADWQAAMGRLEALPFDRVVPGHGAVLDRAGFVRYRQALDGLLRCAASDRPVAACSQAWIEDLGPLLPAASQRSVAPMLNYYFEQSLRAAPAEAARRCDP